jgi:hypothetical protein
MKAFIIASFAAGIIALLAATPASAIPRTWVSSTGAGAACTRAAPCATFQAAHDATDPNGEINCVDAGEYGPVNITKPITIDCAGAVGAITASSSGVVVDTGGVVRLRNLTITHQGSAPGTGILSDSGVARALFVENCTITNFGDGIRLFTFNSATARLWCRTASSAGTTSGSVSVPTCPAPRHARPSTASGARGTRAPGCPQPEASAAASSSCRCATAS